MEPGLLTAGLFGIAALAGFGAAAAVRRSERARPAPLGVAEAIGELGLARDLLEAERFRGVVAGTAVTVELPEHGVGEVVLWGPGLDGAALRLDARVAERARFGWVTGDPVFDGAVRVQTEAPAQAMSVLEARIREAAAEAVRAGAEFTGQRWEARLSAAPSPIGARLLTVARAIGRAHALLADRLAQPEATVLDRLHHDRVPGVRRQALALLLAQNGATAARLGPCLTDIDPDVRVTAAERLGAWPVLVEVVRTGSRSWRVRAATTLARVGASLPAGDAALVREVLERALRDEALASAAAEGLGSIGTTASMPHLVHAARAGPLRARAAARRSVQKLRARLGDSAGGLSLAEGSGGELSVADDD
jgi:hypothetical protein